MDGLAREITQTKRRKLIAAIASFLSVICSVAALILYPTLFPGDSSIALYETVGTFLIAVVVLVILALRWMLSSYIRSLESPESEAE